MATVSKQIADDIIAGKYQDDPPALRIVRYTTPEGDSNNYGVIYRLRDWEKYCPSPWICNPIVYWEDAEAAYTMGGEDERELDELNGDFEGDFF